jgi:pimeloyl-ACP methyl ester carboxylesterase
MTLRCDEIPLSRRSNSGCRLAVVEVDALSRIRALSGPSHVAARLRARQPKGHVMHTIVLIHGLWLAPRSWEGWKARFEERGHEVLVPARRR